MQTLWAPWRMAYIGGASEPGCIFCAASSGADPRAGLVLGRSRGGVVMLNRFPYAYAHLMVAPHAHAADLSALTAGAHAELSALLRRVVALLQEELHPQGMNVGINLGRAAGAGIADHLHWHVVPRWEGDTNFMPVLADVRVMPEHLDAIYDRLRPVFAPLDGRTLNDEPPG